MKLYYDKRLKDPTYYAQQGYRKADGTPTTRNVKKFGKHSELLKITDDPLAYCREQIRLMNEEYRTGTASMQIDIDFNEKVDDTDDACSRSDYVNIGYFYLQYIYQQLDLDVFFKKAAAKRRITYDCNKINRFLTYSRILDPRSKFGTYDHLDTYFEKPDIKYQHIMRFLDVLNDNSVPYLKWLYKNSDNIIKRDSSVIYYDCTNFYFETEKADEAVFDDVTGELLSYGLRQYGVSKEHRPNPIVEMGLLMDKRGIPITMCLDPGNKSEQLTAVPLEKEILPALEDTKLIYCADVGLGSYNIRQFNSMGGRAFIVTQSIKKLSGELKDLIFTDKNYKLLSSDRPITIEEMKSFDRFASDKLFLYNDNAYKVIPADKAVDLGLFEYKENADGSQRKVKAKGTLEQVIIVTFSRKMMEYQRSVRNRQIKRAEQMLKRNDPEEIKKGPNDIRRFMKRIAKTKSGEKAEVSYEMDPEKIAEEEKYDGYYAVATNLTDDKARDIISIMSRRYQIEDCFRIIKTYFNGRPVFCWTPGHIKAHFLICYTALLIYRLLECGLDDKGVHVTTGNLITTLRNMNVADDGMYYRALYKGSQSLNALTLYNDLALDHKKYKPSDLKKKIKKLSGKYSHTTKSDH